MTTIRTGHVMWRWAGMAPFSQDVEALWLDGQIAVFRRSPLGGWETLIDWTDAGAHPEAQESIEVAERLSTKVIMDEVIDANQAVQRLARDLMTPPPKPDFLL